jgi:RecA-family ATPase
VKDKKIVEERNARKVKQGHQQRWVKKSSRVLPLKVLSMKRFLAKEFPVPRRLLGSWLREQYVVLLYAARGVGKTHVALSIAYAVAAGRKFLKWTAPRPREVLYLDGEMQASSMQQRLRRIHKACKSKAALRNLRIVNPDVQSGLLPDLGTETGQAFFDAQVTEKTALIIVDNLSSWCRDGRETAEMWAKINPWALRHRSEGRAVIFVHHAGKNQKQRGTSKREDNVDFSIALRRPAGGSVTDGTLFEWHFEKNRQLSEKKIVPLTVRYGPDANGTWVWSYQKIKLLPTTDEQSVIDRIKKGERQADIARALGKRPDEITRIKKKANFRGWI